MTHPIDPKALAHLGLREDALGEPSTLAWPEVPVSEAKGTAPAVALAAILAGTGGSTLEAPYEALSRLGIHLRVSAAESRIVKVSSRSPEEPLTVRLGAPREDAVAQDQDHADVAVVDTRMSGPFTIEVSGGRVLCIPADDGLTTREEMRFLALQPLESVSAPLADWLADCGDQWLARHVQHLATAGGTWSTAVAAGAYARLGEAESAAEARRRVEALLRGEVDAALARPRVWVRSLSAPQLNTLERLSLAEVDRLREALDELTVAESLEPEESQVGERAEDWLAVCCARDDLEGVALLLAEAGHDARLRRALEALDCEGRRVRLGMPLRGLPLEEQLRRAWLRNPEAWWSQVG